VVPHGEGWLRDPPYHSALSGFTRVTFNAPYAVVVPASVPRISRDPDDDHVIACAVAAQAEIVVSGDAELLVLGHHGDIRIINAASAAAAIEAKR